jgi:hypothetical protein
MEGCRAAAYTMLGDQGGDVPTLDDVYRKFGEVSEAAQLLETELGNILIKIGAAEANLLNEPNPERASEIFKNINRLTLGQLLKNVNSSTESIVHLEALLSRALAERNRLSHSFYRRHNFRRNSDEGRELMLNDLESIHDTLLEAFKAVMLLSGIDLDALAISQLPARHVPI